MENENIIKVSGNLSDFHAMRINNELRSLESKERVCLDFTELRFAQPYGMLFLAQTIREFIDEYSPKKIIVKVRKDRSRSFDEIMKSRPDELRSNPCDYMAHVGFFEDAGIEYGKEPGEAPGSPRYIPITIISFDELYESREDEYTLLGQKAEKLARILVPDEQGAEYRNILQYVIFEALRNAMEHSEDDYVRICGQGWGSGHNSRAEIAILDEGIGVLESLLGNQLYDELISEEEALEKAVEEGVSGNFISRRKNARDTENSGYGLYMLKRICKESGYFLLVSNGTGLKMQKGWDDSWAYSKATGTSLKIEINLSELLKLGNLHKILARYRNESKSPVPPSASSMASNIK